MFFLQIFINISLIYAIIAVKCIFQHIKSSASFIKSPLVPQKLMQQTSCFIPIIFIKPDFLQKLAKNTFDTYICGKRKSKQKEESAQTEHSKKLVISQFCKPVHQ